MSERSTGRGGGLEQRGSVWIERDEGFSAMARPLWVLLEGVRCQRLLTDVIIDELFQISVVLKEVLEGNYISFEVILRDHIIYPHILIIIVFTLNSSDTRHQPGCSNGKTWFR